MEPKFSQDDVIDAALAEFGKMLKNRHALMRQIAKDYYIGDNIPIATQAFENANGLIEMAFRQLCMAAEWEPNMPKPKREGALSEAFHYREMIRTLPPAEFEHLVMGEWQPPAQPAPDAPGEG